MAKMAAGSNDVTYAFFKINIAIDIPNSRNFQAAIEIGLSVVSRELERLRHEFNRDIPKADLDAYGNAITVLHGYFSVDPEVFSERAARLCGRYLETEYACLTRMVSPSVWLKKQF